MCVCVSDIKIEKGGSLFIILEEFEERVPGAVMIVGQMGDEDIKAVATHFRTNN